MVKMDEIEVGISDAIEKIAGVNAVLAKIMEADEQYSTLNDVLSNLFNLLDKIAATEVEV